MRKNQIIFMNGKEKALKALFSGDNSVFGYLAIGYRSDNNGFEDPEVNPEEDEYGGFEELSLVNDYARIPLELDADSIDKDPDTGKVLVKFTATLDESNIKSSQSINQIAVVDTSEVGDTNTIIYAATTFPTFVKTQDSAITFVLGFRL